MAVRFVNVHHDALGVTTSVPDSAVKAMEEKGWRPVTEKSAEPAPTGEPRVIGESGHDPRHAPTLGRPPKTQPAADGDTTKE